MLEFAKYLKESFGEDVSKSDEIIKDRWNKTKRIIREAYSGSFVDRGLAIQRIKNDFMDSRTTPFGIDVDFLKENLSYVLTKLECLSEGEIKIIINNDVDKGGRGKGYCVSEPSIEMGMETESKKTRGRKKKVVEEDMEDTFTISTGEEGIDDGIDNGIDGEVTTDLGTEEETTNKIKITIDGTSVVVEPSESSIECGVSPGEYTFETNEKAMEFVTNLNTLLQGFDIEEDIVTSDAVVNDELASDDFGSAEAEEEVSCKKEGYEEEVEEPEDAGDEPEDAGEEPEDAGEEPEDAGEEEIEDPINWEDVEDDDFEEEVPVKAVGSTVYPKESLDLNKLVDSLVQVDKSWYKVQSITENNEIVGVGKDGSEKTFQLEDIDEMEYEEEVEETTENEEGSEDTNEEPEDAGEEPEDAGEEPEDAGEEPEDAGEEPEDAGEEPEDAAEEEIQNWEKREDWEEEEEEEEEKEEFVDETIPENFNHVANRYLEEETHFSGLTSKVGHINQAKVSVPNPPKAETKKETEANLTSRIGQINQDKVSVASPKTETKKGPEASLTAKPSKPPKTMVKIKDAPKAETKKGPKNSLTAKPSKPGKMNKPK